MKLNWFILSVALLWLAAVPAFAEISVNITSSEEFSVVKEDNIFITADAVSNADIAQVEFFVDDVSIGIDSNAPYSIVWDSVAKPSNKYTIKAVATNSADESNSDQVTVYLVRGVEKSLILDLGSDSHSGEAIEAALASIDIQPVRATSITSTNLDDYLLIFVCLGYRPGNHVLTETESTALSSYLNRGGMLYMEGGDTWSYDPQLPIHSYFGIHGVDDGANDLGLINGVAGTFSEGMSLTTNGMAAYVDHLEAENGGIAIFKNNSPSYVVGVYKDAAKYRTLGCSFELGDVDFAEEETQMVVAKLFALASEIKMGNTALPAIFKLLL